MKMILKNKKGNALLTAVVTMSVLIIITVCVAALSVTNINLSVKSKQYNNTYYLAEAAVQKGMQQVKDSIANYYKQMQSIPVAQYDTTYMAKYNGFFGNVRTDAATAFTEPKFTAPEYSAAGTSTSFSIEDESGASAKIVVQSTANYGGVTKTVRGVLNVQKQHVYEKTGSTYNPTENVLTIGQDMVFNPNTGCINQFRIHGGNAVVGGYEYQNNTDNKKIVPDSGYKVTEAASTFSTNLTYQTLLQKRDTRTPTAWVETAAGPDWHHTQITPSYIEGLPNLSFSITSCGITGQVYCHGNLNFVSGDLDGNLFCDGDVTINNVGIKGNIVAAGKVTFNSGTFGDDKNGWKASSVFAGTDVIVNNGATLTNVLVFATRDYNLNNNPSGKEIVFAGRDINITASNTFARSGSWTCAGNLNWLSGANCWHELTNSPTLSTAVKQHAWYSTYFNTQSITPVPVNLDNIVQSQKLYEN
jgi:hypothetical protein